MTGLLLRRLGISLIVLFIVSIVVFAAPQLIPNDAANNTGLTGPIQQYFGWLAAIFTGDFGSSGLTGEPVSGMLGQHILNSLTLIVGATLIAVPVGILLGVFSAQRHDMRQAPSVPWLSVVVGALPEFVVGIALIALFATSVSQVLPAMTIYAPEANVWAYPLQLILPICTLIFVATPYIVRKTRSILLEALGSEYAEMARLKGVPEKRIVRDHALPNVIGPVTHVVARQLVWLIGAVVVVEYLFAYPGIGKALVDATLHREVQVVQPIALLAAVVTVMLSVLADTVDVLVNPRCRSTT